MLTTSDVFDAMLTTDGTSFNLQRHADLLTEAVLPTHLSEIFDVLVTGEQQHPRYWTM